MSTILKALQRLDREKRVDAARSLEEQLLAQGSVPAAAPRGRSPLALVGAVALVALAGAAAWWLWPAKGAGHAPGASAPAAPERAPVPASLAGAPPAEAPVPAPSPSLAMAEPPPAAEPEPPAPEEPPSLSARHAAAGAAETQPEPAFEPAPPQSAPVEPTAPPAAPASAPAATHTKEKAVAAPKPAHRPAPDVATIRPRPEVWVERTQWHPTPARRRALVKLGDAETAHELGEGDALGPLVIREIQPSGVVFLFDGEEFRRPIGTSTP